MDKLKTIKFHCVSSSDFKDVPVTMSQDSFNRLSDIVVNLCRFSNLKELHEMKDILFHVLIKNYKDDLRTGIKELLEIFEYYEKD